MPPLRGDLTPWAPVAEAALGARFLWHLPAFLRHPLSSEASREILRRRLEHREADFLSLVRHAIYANPTSPYRNLLNLIGCEYGDIERRVNQEGIEGALGTLYRQGVYLTVDEFKGRRPLVRGSVTMAVDPARLQNPYTAFHVPARTSGSRGRETPLVYDFASIRDRAVNTCLTLEARGGTDWVKAVWGVPGAGVGLMLRYSAFGRPAVRWFSQLHPSASSLHPRYRWSARALRWGSLLAGVPLRAAQYVPLDDPLPIARWMADARRCGGTPHLWAFTSSAVRLCQAAAEAGLDLSGAQLTVTGEPVTAARLAAIRRAGVDAVPDYGSAEAGGPASYGCLAPEASDDLHLYHDLHALIQPGSDGAHNGLPPHAVLISSLRLTSPLILLNVSMGDQAIVGQRACGCPLERLGWTTHLHTVRSYEKLTAGGMTFLDTDVIRVLEEVLPARFGGGPADYQLVEAANADSPSLRLLVHPRIGPFDAGAVADAFLTAIGGGSGVRRLMELQWRQAALLQVERRPPITAPSGKILHLHQEGAPAPASAPSRQR